MSEEEKVTQAQAVYNALCEMLDDHDWRYQKLEEELSIKCGAQGEDLPMEILVEVDKERQLVSLISFMPFTIPENRRAALAVAVSQANNGMVDGSFDYNYLTGRIMFRMTSSYRESIIGQNVFDYMITCACYTIDDYNDKFLAIANNEMSVEEILEYIK